MSSGLIQPNEHNVGGYDIIQKNLEWHSTIDERTRGLVDHSLPDTFNVYRGRGLTPSQKARKRRGDRWRVAGRSGSPSVGLERSPGDRHVSWAQEGESGETLNEFLTRVREAHDSGTGDSTTLMLTEDKKSLRLKLFETIAREHRSSDQGLSAFLHGVERACLRESFLDTDTVNEVLRDVRGYLVALSSSSSSSSSDHDEEEGGGEGRGADKGRPSRAKDLEGGATSNGSEGGGKSNSRKEAPMPYYKRTLAVQVERPSSSSSAPTTAAEPAQPAPIDSCPPREIPSSLSPLSSSTAPTTPSGSSLPAATTAVTEPSSTPTLVTSTLQAVPSSS